MILDILKEARSTFREVVSLASPMDAKKPVIIDSKPKSSAPFEAYTDNRSIFININAEAKIQKDLERIVVPAYRAASSRLYDVGKTISDKELLKNLTFDAFLFLLFHEQLHPTFCPNSTDDEKEITKAIFEGVMLAEPGLTSLEAMLKTNNSKNLIWDVVVNTAFIAKTYAASSDILGGKITFVFKKNGREVEYQPITHYPSGIVPILYMTSAADGKTDVPISLMGALYSTLSYNVHDVRERAFGVFIDDLKKKGIDEAIAMQTVQNLYLGLISEIKPKELTAAGIDPKEYKSRAGDVLRLKSTGYEQNQTYFISAISKIFDSPTLRYDSLKGFARVLSPFITLDKKQGSPDKNTSGQSGGAQGGSGSGQSQDSSEGEDSGDDDGSDSDGDSDGDNDGDGKSGGKGGKGGKSDQDMEGDSLDQTIQDLLDTLNGKDSDGLINDLANPSQAIRGAGRGAGGPSPATIMRVSIRGIDEFYKKHADTIEVKNPSQQNFSVELGSQKKWKLVRSSSLNSAEISRLNFKRILDFQKSTGLPVLLDQGHGFHRLNEYKVVETPFKSYNSQLTGIEIPSNWVVIQDSSGSMGSFPYAGTGCSFDVLNRVKYGLLKGLYEVCKKMKKDVKFGVVNFSSSTQYAGLDSLVKLFDAGSHPIKAISLIPQCGGTALNTAVFQKVFKDLAPGTTIYTLVSDGEISNSDEVYSAVAKIADRPDTAFIFFEMGYMSNLGTKVQALTKAKPNVSYYHIDKIQEIKEKMSSILIKYK